MLIQPVRKAGRLALWLKVWLWTHVDIKRIIVSCVYLRYRRALFDKWISWISGCPDCPDSHVRWDGHPAQGVGTERPICTKHLYREICTTRHCLLLIASLYPTTASPCSSWDLVFTSDTEILFFVLLLISAFDQTSLRSDREEQCSCLTTHV